MVEKEGGAMKNFIMNSILTMFIIGVSQDAILARGDETKTIAAYDNKVTSIVYSVGSNDQHAITLTSERDPICIYVPLSYKDNSDDSLTKTYILPRMKSSKSQLRYLNDDLRQRLEKIGVDLQIEAFEKTYYGLRLSFTMQSPDAYDIVRIIDANKKSVRFEIVAKM